MAEVSWTKEQKQAIYSAGRNILVAAAAGSGKTAVLVERIINKVVNEKVDIDQILVVTFTNAAASEMKERVLEAIYKRLDKEPENLNLQRQVNLLHKSNICTIDSFCLDVLRNNFFELEDVNPNFRLGDTSEIELLKIEVLEEMFEEKYESYEQNFIELINTYTSYKDDSTLKELILQVHNYISSMPFPEKWLNEAINKFDIKNEEDFSNTVWGKELLETAKFELVDSLKSIEQALDLVDDNSDFEGYKKVLLKDKEKIEQILNNADNWDNANEMCQNISFDRLPTNKGDEVTREMVKNLRSDVKDNFTKKELSRIFISSSADVVKDILEMRGVLIKLEGLVQEFLTRFIKKKKEKNILDFSDIEHYALKILVHEDENGKMVPSNVAKKYQEKFNEIAIDEYQDSNYVQESILTSVSTGNNIFMVGDVKQSIYKFRHSVPDLFISKYDTYEKEENITEDNKCGLLIQLFNNFRSRENVLDLTNLVFENIMSKKLGDIDYTEEEYLNLGANYLESKEELKTEIKIIDMSSKEDDEEESNQEIIEKIELEAAFVAEKIDKMIKEKYQIYDMKNKIFRDIKYKDIVILLRSTKGVANVFEKALIDRQIAVYLENSSEYLETLEIQTVIHLLKIIDNPIQDIPLVSVMRSNIFGFTDNELIEIRLNGKKETMYNAVLKARISVDEKLKNKIDKMLDTLENWRKVAEYLALDEFIWKIYSDTGFYNFVGLLKNGQQRQANLKMLFEKAKQYEQASFKGLYNFITFIERLKLNKGDMASAKIIGENEDVVRIMSIHKSKGLEFPVVFLSNSSKKFNLNDVKNDILLHNDLGIGVEYINYEKQIRYNTLTKKAIETKMKKESKAEEMRVLYVALTRAKEKLIVTSTTKDYIKEKEKLEEIVKVYKKEEGKINPILVGKYLSYLDYILLTLMYEKTNAEKLVDIEIIKKEDVIRKISEIGQNEEEDFDVIKELEKANEKQNNNINSNKKIEEMITHNYVNIVDTQLPTKTSVTQIKKMKELKKYQTEEFKENEIGETKEKEFPKPTFLIEKEENISAAKKGTLVHMCIEQLDENVEYDKKSVEKIVDDLEGKKIITKKEKDSINIYKILAYTKSKIWKDLKTAKKIYKEKPFYINHTAEDFVKDNLDEKHKENKNILVQGVIDLYYIDNEDKLILVDYKTDYVKGTGEELITKYKEQLNIYKLALEEALDRVVDEIYIYSTHLEKEIKVNKQK